MNAEHVLDVIGFPSQLEPVGLDRGNSKRPDCMTISPFSDGWFLIWDVTCRNTFSRNSLVWSVTNPGSVARQAQAKPNVKLLLVLQQVYVRLCGKGRPAFLSPTPYSCSPLLEYCSSTSPSPSAPEQWLFLFVCWDQEAVWLPGSCTFYFIR